jgi:hypothetical protein
MHSVTPRYHTRFIPASLAGELIDLYHLARTPLSGQACTRYDRMIWASNEFHKAHPEVSSNGAYKDLDGLLA